MSVPPEALFMHVWEADDGARINGAGLAYGHIHGDLKPGDVEVVEGDLIVRGKLYRRVE